MYLCMYLGVGFEQVDFVGKLSNRVFVRYHVMILSGNTFRLSPTSSHPEICHRLELAEMDPPDLRCFAGQVEWI